MSEKKKKKKKFVEKGMHVAIYKRISVKFFSSVY